MLQQREIVALSPYVRQYAAINRSAAAFDAAYGLEGRSALSSFSKTEEPSGRSPYTSSVEIW